MEVKTYVDYEMPESETGTDTVVCTTVAFSEPNSLSICQLANPTLGIMQVSTRVYEYTRLDVELSMAFEVEILRRIISFDRLFRRLSAGDCYAGLVVNCKLHDAKDEILIWLQLRELQRYQSRQMDRPGERYQIILSRESIFNESGD